MDQPTPDATTRGTGTVRVFLAAWVLLAGLASDFGAGSDAMSRNHVELAVSLVDDGDPVLDEFVDGFAPGGKDEEDKSLRNGHYYSGMPPGAGFLTVPVYAALRPAVNIAVRHAGSRGSYTPAFVRVSIVALLATVLVCAPIAAGAVAALYARLRRMGGSMHESLLLAAGLAVGTLFLFNGTRLSHKLIATCLVWFAAMLVPTQRKPGTWRGWVLCGFLLMSAVAVEYSLALAVPVVGLYGWWRSGWRWRAPLGMLAGAAVPLVVLLVYHTVCFGGPTRVPYGFRAWGARWHKAGTYGAGAPSPFKAAMLLGGIEVGLLYFSPFLALGVVGLVRGLVRRSSPQRALAVVGIVLAIVFWVYNSSLDVVWRGSSFGPRFLLPAVPWLVLGVAWLGRFRWRNALLAVLIAVSALMNVLPRLTWFPGQNYPGVVTALGALVRHGPHTYGVDFAHKIGVVPGGWIAALSVAQVLMAAVAAGVILMPLRRPPRPIAVVDHPTARPHG